MVPEEVMSGTLEGYKKAILDLGEAKGEVYYLDSLEKEIEVAFRSNESPVIFARNHRYALLTPPDPDPPVGNVWMNPIGPPAAATARPTNLRDKEREDLMNYSCRMKAWAVAFWWNAVLLLVFLYLQHGAEMRVRQLCLEDGIDGTNFIENIKHQYHETFFLAFILGTLAVPIIWLMMVDFLAAFAASAVNLNRF